MEMLSIFVLDTLVEFNCKVCKFKSFSVTEATFPQFAILILVAATLSKFMVVRLLELFIVRLCIELFLIMRLLNFMALL